MVRNMKRWTNILLVYIALGAVLLIIARGLLPVMGLSGVEGELVQRLAELTPILLVITAGSVVLIALNLKRQSKFSRRLVEEGADLNEEFFIVGAIEEPRLNTQVFPEQAYAYQGAELQSDGNVFNGGNESAEELSWEQTPDPDISAMNDETESWKQEMAVIASISASGTATGAANGPASGPADLPANIPMNTPINGSTTGIGAGPKRRADHRSERGAERRDRLRTKRRD